MTDTQNDSTVNQAASELEECPYSCSLTELPPAAAYNTPLVTIKVGPDMRKFMIHKGLLHHYSSYLEAALNHKLQASEDSIIELPDHDEEAFAVLNGWLYTRRLLDPSADQDKVSHKTLCQVYLLGDTLCMPAIKNAAMDAIGAKIINEWKTFTSGLRHVYDNAPRGSPLRKLGTDIALEEYCEFALGPDFLSDLADEVGKDNVARRIVSSDKRYDTNKCQYHDHGSDRGIS